MSSETIYKCDKCNKEGISTKLHGITISFNGAYNSKARNCSKGFDLCSLCAQKLTMVDLKILDEAVVVETQPDLKDRLFDVVADMLCDMGVQIQP